MHSMNYLGKFISNFRYVYNEINAATLTGAIDVVVVEQPDGSYTCSPFHVRFGKIGVLRSREKVVDIEINGEPVDIHMKLGESGEAFFVEEVPPGEEGEEEFIPPHLACSPIPIESSFPERFLAERSKSDQWNGFNVHGPVPVSVLGGECEEDEEDEDGVEEKPVVVLAGNMPKTFRAETIESVDKKEMVRKLSTVSGDFRPIVGSSSSGGSASGGVVGRRDSADVAASSQQSHSTTDLMIDESPMTERVSSSLPANKRKRRKKSLMKKKNNNSSNNINNNNNSANNNNSGVNSVSIVKKLSSSEPTETVVNSASQQPDSESIFQIEDIEQSGQMNLLDNDSNSSTSKDELSRIQNAPVENDLHFFSDTEITPGCSPHDARQFTPVQSDTEFETKRMLTNSESDECKGSEEPPQQSWRWGELPTSNHEDSGKQDDPHRSMLHNMLGFMKKTKHIRHNRDNEGIYLSDINIDELDPEVAALYFPTSYKQVQQRSNNTGGGSGSGNDEDAESGNGPSLPQSPHSVEGAIGGPKSLDSDFEEPKHGIYHTKEVFMSLCGGLDRPEGPSEQLFQERLVHYEDFIENPGILENPDLVVRIDGKMYRWRAACSIIMSHLVYNKSLPQDVISRLSEASPNTRQEKRKGQRRGYSSWFTWGVRAADAGVVGGKEGGIQDGTVTAATVEQGEPGALDKSQPIATELASKTENEAAGVTEAPQETGSDVTLTASQESESATAKVSSTTESATPVSSDIPIHNPSPMNQTMPRSAKSLAGEQVYSTSSDSESEFDRGQRHPKAPGLSIPLDRTHRSANSDKYRKTLRLSSDLIAKLNLQEGANEVEFSVTTAYQGTSRCKCFLFRWRYDDKIVISDIDGTITKSDVLGHILPIVGKDWAQSGVAKLFTKIKNNGYKLLYLSARAIGQSRLTRDYLKSIKQEDLSLPEGPILLNPTSLLTAFHTEVIEKKPEEFKISCLRDIQALFPTNANPFYAGYGNKINDVWAYQAVGIPIFRIFTINHRGELKHELTQTFQSSYSNMSYIVDQMFPAPPVRATLEDFSQFMFWREPIPDLGLKLEADHSQTGSSTQAAV